MVSEKFDQGERPTSPLSFDRGKVLFLSVIRSNSLRTTSI